MDDDRDTQQVIIRIVPGSHGPEFDRRRLDLPIGATTVWVNQTEMPQVILPDHEGTRRVMRLAPTGQEGAVWMMRMRSSQQPVTPGGTFGWRLLTNEASRITIVMSAKPMGA